MRAYRRWIYLLSFSVAALIVPLGAHAQKVTSWVSNIEVAQSGVVTVKESITYDPEDGMHHGIERTVPAELHAPGSQTYYSSVKLINVTDGQGQQLPIDTQRINRQGLDLRIGDAHTTIAPGPHLYVITYSLTPLLTHTSAGDRLNIDVFSNTWKTAIEQASATITLPRGVTLSSFKCYTGTADFTASDCTATQSAPDTLSVATTRALAAGEALTADVSLPALSLGSYLEAGKQPPFSPLELGSMGLLGLANLGLAGGIILWLRDWSRQYKARRDQTIVPEYEPPANLTPAHLSILESPAADAADITATLIHLATRGILKIEQTQAKTWFSNADYRLTLLKSDDPTLALFESTLLVGIFQGQTEVELSSLRNRMPPLTSTINEFRKLLGSDLASAGYFLSSPTGYTGTWRALAGVGVPVVSGWAATQLIAGVTLQALVVGGAAVALAGLFIYMVRRPTGRTAAGNAGWAQVRGFKWFLEVTEKDRLNFSDAPEKTPELFSKMLPYAVALKVEKAWARQFAGIDVGRAVGGWYAGYAIGSFSADSFTNTFATSFGSAMSANFSGASGSGSAGGGGGGGW